MEKATIGKDLEICRILNGMWQVAGGHGQIDSKLAIQDMQKYQESGFTTWDLADIYGPAESLIGDFSEKVEQDVQAFTKFVPNPGPMSNSIVTYYIDESLKKMNVDCIDLLQFHWWDYQDSNYINALQHLSKLQEDGKIKNLSTLLKPFQIDAPNFQPISITASAKGSLKFTEYFIGNSLLEYMFSPI